MLSVWLFLLGEKIIFTRHVYTTQPWNEWNISEWLINYEGGLVRRGLSGEIIRLVATTLSHNPFDAILAITLTVYAMICVAFVVRVVSFTGAPRIWLYIVMLCPALILFPIEDGSLFRKDVLAVAVTFLHILLCEAILSRQHQLRRPVAFYTSASFFIFGLPSALFALLHEGLYAFALLPSNALLCLATLRRLGADRTALRTPLFALIFLPGLLTLALAVTHPGGAPAAMAICRSWEPTIPNLDCADHLPWGVKALQMTFFEGLRYGWWLVKSGEAFFYFFLVPLWALVVVVASIMITGSPALVRRLAVVGVPILLAAPLYVIGWDWGRWSFVLLMQSSFVLFSRQLMEPHFWALPASLAHPARLLSEWLVRRAQSLSLPQLLMQPYLPLFFVLLLGMPHAGISTARIVGSSLLGSCIVELPEPPYSTTMYRRCWVVRDASHPKAAHQAPRRTEAVPDDAGHRPSAATAAA
jgi:hypothetical protein